jgi:hypothetical protein
LIAPEIVVALGAVRALLAPEARVLVNRGKFFDSPFGERILVAVHRLRPRNPHLRGSSLPIEVNIRDRHVAFIR